MEKRSSEVDNNPSNKRIRMEKTPSDNSASEKRQALLAVWQSLSQDSQNVSMPEIDNYALFTEHRKQFYNDIIKKGEKKDDYALFTAMDRRKQFYEDHYNKIIKTGKDVQSDIINLSAELDTLERGKRTGHIENAGKLEQISKHLEERTKALGDIVERAQAFMRFSVHLQWDKICMDYDNKNLKRYYIHENGIRHIDIEKKIISLLRTGNSLQRDIAEWGENLESFKKYILALYQNPDIIRQQILEENAGETAEKKENRQFLQARFNTVRQELNNYLSNIPPQKEYNLEIWSNDQWNEFARSFIQDRIRYLNITIENLNPLINERNRLAEESNRLIGKPLYWSQNLNKRLRDFARNIVQADIKKDNGMYELLWEELKENPVEDQDMQRQLENSIRIELRDVKGLVEKDTSSGYYKNQGDLNKNGKAKLESIMNQIKRKLKET